MHDMVSRPELYRRHALDALRIYWSFGEQYITKLPCAADSEFCPPCTGAEFAFVSLPEWATDIAVEGSLLVPVDCI